MDEKGCIKVLTSEPIPKELPFSISEYQDRVARVRKRMEEAGLDVLLVTFLPSVNYMTGYNAFAVDLHTCFVLPLKGDPVMQTASLEAPVVLIKGWVEDIVSYDWHEVKGISGQLADILRERGLDNKTIGVETRRAGLTTEVFEGLKRELPEARFQEATDVVLRLRMVKSPKELEYMRKAARITYEGTKASLAAVAAGKLDNDIAKTGYEAMVGAGSEFFSSQPIVTTGHRAGYVHITFARVPIKEGDTVFMEYGGVYHRYAVPTMRTAYVGQPTAQVMRVTDAVKETVNRILEYVRPGRTCHEVALEARKGHQNVDDEVYFSGVYGYAVGVSFPPTWREFSNFIAEGVEAPLEPGLTFHLPICLRVPGKLGVGLSETIAITESGCEVLTQQERDLHIVPA